MWHEFESSPVFSEACQTPSIKGKVKGTIMVNETEKLGGCTVAFCFFMSNMFLVNFKYSEENFTSW